MEDSIRHSMQSLFLVLAIVGFALFLSKQRKRNPLTALLLTGVAIALIKPTNLNLELLAGFGILALLFDAGVKLSAGLLQSMWRDMVVGGLIQVLLTVAIVGFCFIVSGASWQTAIFMGFLVAMSSTALAIRYFESRGEMSTPQGRVSLGIFLQQDLWLLPLSPLIPLLAPNAGQTGGWFYPLVLGVVVLGGFYLLSRWIVNPLLTATARIRSPETSIIVTMCLCIGSALITSHAGMSIALGGFLAGLMISSNENRHESHAAIKPFTHVFGAFFFVSIGTLLDLKILWGHWFLILLAVLGVILVKFVTGLVATRALGYSTRVSVIVAAGLSHIGELSVVLASIGKGAGLLPEEHYQLFVAVAVLSMMLMPLLMFLANRVARQIPEIGIAHATAKPTVRHQSMDHDTLKGHVVVIGYGPVGHFQAVLLKRNNIPFVVLEMNPGTIKQLKKDQMPFVIGDCSRREILEHVGIAKAKLIIIAISDDQVLERTISVIKEDAPAIPIIVRVRYWAHAKRLAPQVSVAVAEDVAAGMYMQREVAKRLGIPQPPATDVEAMIADVIASFSR